MSNNNVTKKFSRRKAGNYGRPGSKAQKRIASKSARRFNAISVEDAFMRDSVEGILRLEPSAAEIAELDAEFEREREYDIEMLIEGEREESLFYNEKFGSDSEFEQQVFDGAGR